MLTARFGLAIFVGFCAHTALAQTPAGQPDSPGRLLDRVVAVVDGQVMTLSALEFEARVALIQHGAPQAADAVLDESTLRASLDYAIGQRLHAQEAEKLQAFQVEEGEVDKALKDFEQQIGGKTALESFLKRNDADLQQLGTVLARGMRAERILDSRIRLKAQVSDADVRRYYDEHQAELTGTYEELRSQLKDKLVREKYQELARQEMAQLRRTANVRIIAPFAREPAHSESGGRP